MVLHYKKCSSITIIMNLGLYTVILLRILNVEGYQMNSEFFSYI